MIIAVLGSEDREGVFHVVDVCFPKLEPQPSLGQEGSWIALVSGLEFGTSSSYGLEMQLLLDFLLGEAGQPEDQTLSQQITRVIVCGNLFNPENGKSNTATNNFGMEEQVFDPTPLETCDDWLTALASGLPVDVMPGKNDPASALMPQQPVHSSLFPKACGYSSLCAVTNPHVFKTDGARYLV